MTDDSRGMYRLRRNISCLVFWRTPLSKHRRISIVPTGFSMVPLRVSVVSVNMTYWYPEYKQRRTKDAHQAIWPVWCGMWQTNCSILFHQEGADSVDGIFSYPPKYKHGTARHILAFVSNGFQNNFRANAVQSGHTNTHPSKVFVSHSLFNEHKTNWWANPHPQN